MRFVTLSFAIVLGIGLLGCASRDSIVSQAQRPSGQASQNSGTPAPPADTARRITAADAHKLFEQGDILVIDVRTEVAYKESHIKGAILIPVNEVAAKANELPRDKTIVTYCT
jgi:hypothetical protein